MRFHDIKIQQEDIRRHHVFVDGKEINGVREVDYHVAVDEVPQVGINVMAGVCDIGAYAETHLNVDIDSVEDAIKCLRFAMAIDKEFFKAIIASAKSVIDEVRGDNQTDVVNDYELAKRIVYRIFWGDDVCM